MRLGRFVGRLDRLAGRFNKWFGPTAVAAGVERTGAAGGPPTIDPLAVNVVLADIERETVDEDEADSATRE